ncbi:MAG: N-acetyltransferase [Actinomycetota bacterium]|nr:N-acetyltransferase [Actinomycetota bacterium]
MIVTYREQPALWTRSDEAFVGLWPEYNLHGDVLSRYWPALVEVFPDFQVMLYDETIDAVTGRGQAIPCWWDGTTGGLPSGIDAVVEQGFRRHEQGRRPNTLSALAVEIAPQHQARQLSRVVLQGLRALAADHGFGDLIVPLRPSWKERYPLTPIERYVAWTRGDGLPFDPWIRVHHRLGADLLRPAPQSLRITGTVAQWEQWTGMRFPESRDYVFPRGLAPLTVEVEADQGRYWEPNVWMRHPIGSG